MIENGETMSQPATETEPVPILVVDDEPQIRDLVSGHLRRTGYAVHSAESGEQAVELVRNIAPDIVLADVMMPEMNGIELLRAIKEIKPETVVVLMTGFSSEEVVLSALKHGAADFLKKPFTLSAISDVLTQIVERLRARGHGRVAKERLVDFSHSGSIDVPIDPSSVSQTVANLIGEMEPFASPDEVESLHVCAYEVVMNAIEHGVLRIGYETKSRMQEEGRLEELYKERIWSGDFPGRVRVDYEIAPGKATIAVEDTGPGFDVSSLPDPTLGDALFESHGRGLMLAQMMADELTFNEQGNRVTVTKELAGPSTNS